MGMRQYFILAEGSITVDFVIFNEGIMEMYDRICKGYTLKPEEYYHVSIEQGQTVLFPIGTMMRFNAHADSVFIGYF